MLPVTQGKGRAALCDSEQPFGLPCSALGPPEVLGTHLAGAGLPLTGARKDFLSAFRFLPQSISTLCFTLF